MKDGVSQVFWGINTQVFGIQKKSMHLKDLHKCNYLTSAITQTLSWLQKYFCKVHNFIDIKN